MNRSPAVVDAPGGVACSWALTLSEPLLTTSHRVYLDQQMRQLCERHTPWTAAFFGGVLADIVRTLPDGDPWRDLSGRLPDCIVGTPPPDGSFGAWRPDGSQFGTVSDAYDLLPQMSMDPALDPALAALAPGLPPQSAALLAFAEAGWAPCRDACLVVAQLPGVNLGEVPPEAERTRAHLTLVPGMPPAQVRDSLVEGLFESASCALRWALHRRRAHLGVDAITDTWLTESAHHWSWRADRILADKPWPVRQVEREILQARIVSGPAEDSF